VSAAARCSHAQRDRGARGRRCCPPRRAEPEQLERALACSACNRISGWVLCSCEGAVTPEPAPERRARGAPPIVFGLPCCGARAVPFVPGEPPRDEDIQIDLDLDRLILEGLLLADQSGPKPKSPLLADLRFRGGSVDFASASSSARWIFFCFRPDLVVREQLLQRDHLGVRSASSAGTATSGSTPTPSHFVFVIGLIRASVRDERREVISEPHHVARVRGRPRCARRRSSRASGSCRLYENSSAASP